MGTPKLANDLTREESSGPVAEHRAPGNGFYGSDAVRDERATIALLRERVRRAGNGVEQLIEREFGEVSFGHTVPQD
jgi:hypothetical protein